MKLTPFRIIVSLLVSLSAFQVQAQTPVTSAADPEKLFTSSDTRLHKNKQVVYHIVKDLLECNHWELADKYIAEDYIQHNPNAANGREAVVKFFTNVLKVKPSPIPDKMKSKVVSVVAEGDLVTVAFVKEEKNPNDPGKTYTTTWFDQWRIVNGKAVEHWDGATLFAK
ncbi:nuclear transport factor 2 family protein [Cytophagaceae bacterium DM2B3-1]|uniref:Nuclear transport factor 2 family protein n=1 Tax=Xanthocytophaga flava TaxID=3048013 RepID=A0ABT7CHF3_9BACT|nr:nuclear transport factor 2 family protein [Xanthocytophaga flavus]MDJ1472392.1 nuclear transport factor 2 family protein [Xanthocytophaga flavus]MDJ1493092.1 nuclear transport factor 2 family protein [Xanthocytophaga flavus]